MNMPISVHSPRTLVLVFDLEHPPSSSLLSREDEQLYSWSACLLYLPSLSIQLLSKLLHLKHVVANVTANTPV